MKDRILVVQRVRPEAVGVLLEDGAEPRLTAGYALLVLCYSRRRNARVLGRLLPGVEELSLHVPRVDDTSWRVAGLPEGGLSFDHDADRFGLSLTVRDGEQEQLYLRAEPRGLPTGSVFGSARDAAELLTHGQGLAVPDDRALEPLEVMELRAPFLDACGDAAGELDSAFRLVERRAQPLRARLHERLEPGSSASPLPTS